MNRMYGKEKRAAEPDRRGTNRIFFGFLSAAIIAAIGIGTAVDVRKLFFNLEDKSGDVVPPDISHLRALAAEKISKMRANVKARAIKISIENEPRENTSHLRLDPTSQQTQELLEPISEGLNAMGYSGERVISFSTGEIDNYLTVSTEEIRDFARVRVDLETQNYEVVIPEVTQKANRNYVFGALDRDDVINLIGAAVAVNERCKDIAREYAGQEGGQVPVIALYVYDVGMFRLIDEFGGVFEKEEK